MFPQGPTFFVITSLAAMLLGRLPPVTFPDGLLGIVSGNKSVNEETAYSTANFSLPIKIRNKNETGPSSNNQGPEQVASINTTQFTINEVIRGVPSFSQACIFDCLSMKFGMEAYRSTHYGNQQTDRFLSADKETAKELKKLNGAIQDLGNKLEVTKTTQVRSAFAPATSAFENKQFLNSSPPTLLKSAKVSLRRPWISSDSIDKIGWLAPTILLWLIVTAQIALSLFRLFWKTSPSKDNDTNKPLQIEAELRQLQMEIQKLKKISENFSSTEKTSSSNHKFPRTLPKHDPVPSPRLLSLPVRTNSDNDHLADFRAKLAQETAEKRRAQQKHYDKLREEQERKHEEEMRERESKFKTVIKEKIEMAKEDFLQWATIPD